MSQVTSVWAIWCWWNSLLDCRLTWWYVVEWGRVHGKHCWPLAWRCLVVRKALPRLPSCSMPMVTCEMPVVAVAAITTTTKLSECLDEPLEMNLSFLRILEHAGVGQNL